MDNSTVIDSTAVPVSNIGLQSVLRIPAVRQIILLVGVAGAVAAGLAVFMWAQTPGYAPIYSGKDSAEAAEIASALATSNIPHKINPSDGSVLVEESQMMEARMHLAGQGITPGLNQKDLSEGAFGRTANVERTLLNQRLEVSLARTISNLGAVRQATVHLAVPEQRSFVGRQVKEATASVVVHTYGGAMLDARQAHAISQLVATSVPGLEQKNVTLLDQHGRMLTSGELNSSDAMAASQLDYQMKLEDKYRRAIEGILTPLVGYGKVQAQVSADIDFSQREVAREDYDAANAAVVSRQVSETNVGGVESPAGGIPGALSNQPPEAGGTTPTEAEQIARRNTSRDSVENFEVPKSISYEKQPVTIRRLSVAVLVDDTPVESGDGAATGLTPADIERLTALTRETIGINDARGDTVVVTAAPFRNAIVEEPVEPPAIWERPVVRDIAKQVLGAAVVLAIVFGVVRPMLSNVVASHAESQSAQAAMAGAAGGGHAALAAPNYDDKVTAARNISGHDPARVAQVVKQWVGDNRG